MKKRNLMLMVIFTLCLLFCMPAHASAKKIGKYSGKGVKIAVYKRKYNGITYFAAHVNLKKGSYSKMHLAKANGKRSNGFQYISKIAKKNKAILAVNGPFNGEDSDNWDAYGKTSCRLAYHNYYEIANGVHYDGTLGTDRVGSGASYSASTGILCQANQQAGVEQTMTLTTASNLGLISDTFYGDMGFTILENGNILGEKAGYGRQRTFIGTNGNAGDIWIVVNNGSKTTGFDMYDCGVVLKSLGCTYGYNLDGGGSSTMIFKGKKLNSNKERKCYDALVIAK